MVVVDGDGKFRQFLAGCEREHGVTLKIGVECTSYPQATDLAERRPEVAKLVRALGGGKP